MILPDINLLIYAYNVDAPLHSRAKIWWERVMSETEPVGIPWAVIFGFIRIITHRSILERPFSPADALTNVRQWLSRNHVQILQPGSRHLDIFEHLLSECGTAGNLTTDAHLAALAIEHQCELHSNDMDFGRFSGLRWRNPLTDLSKRRR